MNSIYVLSTSFTINSSSRYEKTPYVTKEQSRFGVSMGSYNAQVSNTDKTIIDWQASGYIR